MPIWSWPRARSGPAKAMAVARANESGYNVPERLGLDIT
jgi:hypothetical protein